jgi:hypothetical protein
VKRKLVTLFVAALLLFILFRPAPVSSQIQVPSATPRVTATPIMQPERSGQRAQTATPDVVEPGVMILSEPLDTYLYHLDNQNRRVFETANIIPPGQLVKVSACLGDYTQVEYQAKPGYWRVAFAKLDICQ